MLEALGIEGFDAIGTLGIAARLIAAALLGAVVGFEREQKGRAAGLRTHMLVAVGAAMFTIVPMELSDDGVELEEIVKGIASGVGFLGAGTILKRTSEEEIQGLTTAAGIWMTATVGFAAGAGLITAAILGCVLALLTLGVATALEPDDS